MHLVFEKRVNNWNGSFLKGECLHMRCAAHILSWTVGDRLSEVSVSAAKNVKFSC